MAFDLGDFGVDLTARARAGRLDPVCGREAETNRVIRILARKTKNNPVLLGEPGVGKTAVVEGLATRIVEGAVPSDLARCTIFSLNIGDLLAGTGYRGDFEQRLRDLISALRKPGSARILFVDEIHLLGQAGRSEGGLDAANLLKPLLARGELPCIGASTPEEWRQMVERDPAMERRFQPVEVREPTPGEALEMLRTLRQRFEDHHFVRITDEALEAAVQLPVGDSALRKLPDRAIDALDEACAMLRIQAVAEPSAEYLAARRELRRARDAFDLERVARLSSRVLPKLRLPDPPRLDAALVLLANERISGG